MMAKRINMYYYTLFPQGLIEQASSNNNLKTITQFFIFGIIDNVLKMWHVLNSEITIGNQWRTLKCKICKK